MPEINLSNNKGRDATLLYERTASAKQTKWVDPEGRPVHSRKLIRSTGETSMDALLRRAEGDLEAVVQSLIEGDPEIDLERVGRFVEDTSSIYRNEDGEFVHKILRWEVEIKGDEEIRRPKIASEANVSADFPLSWTGRFIPKGKAVRRFVFSQTYQIRHVNGLTFDFLFEMATELEQRGSLMLLGGGEQGKDPLVFQRGARAYRGFLEGRTDGNKYMLLLHLTDTELKKPS